MNAIEINGISKSYGQVRAVSDVSLKVEEGDSAVDVLPKPRKMVALPEVEVKERRFTDNARAAWENEINGAHVSNIYYDCDRICDEIADRGEEIPGFDDWLAAKNPFFEYEYGARGQRIWYYKGRIVLWVLNNNSSREDFPIFLDELKSIYICDDNVTWYRYNRSDIFARYPAVTVFLYTHHKFLRNVKGVRRTHFEGYNEPSTFEMNDYSVLPASFLRWRTSAGRCIGIRT